LGSPGIAGATDDGARDPLRTAIVAKNHSQTDGQVLLGTQYAERGVRSIAVLPLIVPGRTTASLPCTPARWEFFHAEELKLLMGIGRRHRFAVVHLGQTASARSTCVLHELTELPNRTRFIEQ